MVEVARFFMEFCMDESCGKCIPCRAGTVQMHRLLTQIVAGRGDAGGPGAARSALRHGQAHQPVRPGPDGPEPGAEHAALLPPRVRGAAAADAAARRQRPLALAVSIAPAKEDDRMACQDPDDRRQAGHRPRRTRRSSRRPARPASPSRRSATSTASRTSAPAGSAWSRSAAAQAAAGLRHHGRRGHGGPDRHATAARIPPDDRRAAASPSATTSARSAWPTATASCRTWPSPSAWTTSASSTSTRRCAVDVSHERFGIDHNRCILCTRCVRVCDEIEGAHTWDVAGRGTQRAGHHRPEPAVGRRRRPAPRAASACRPARPGRSSARARPSPRWSTTASGSPS